MLLIVYFIRNLSQDIFSPGTGISDDEVRKIMRVRVSSKQMDLDQQVAAGNKVIKRLKDTLSALTKGKNEFVYVKISTILYENTQLCLQKMRRLS